MFPKLIKRAERTNEGFSVLVVDVNDLKKVNDSHGHIAGDEVIRYIAHTLLVCTRKYDFVTRWGGDEFVILAPGTDQVEALRMTDRITENLHTIKIHNGYQLKPTVSVGTQCTLSTVKHLTI